jgi:Flp pilus assembly protein TadB
MTAAILLGLTAGLGCVGVAAGLRTPLTPLAEIAGTMQRPARSSRQTPVDGDPTRIGQSAARWLINRGVLSHPRMESLGPTMAVSGQTLEGLLTRMLIAAGAGMLLPPLLWTFAAISGLAVPLAVPIFATALLVAIGLLLPVAALAKRARERRRHFRFVIGTFVDLVVLSLAGGVGVEGALFAASQVSSDWAAQTIARSLYRARDGGRSPWAALGQLGDELGIAELVELAATLQLAGTEGARIRQALQARAVTLRRHEQAEAESAANATTERLFIPGALLLVGFLLFVGYPAFSRILGGF